MTTQQTAANNSPTRPNAVLAHLVPSFFLAYLIAIKFPFDIYWGNIEQFSSWNIQIVAPLLLVMLALFTVTYLPILVLPRQFRLIYFTVASVVAIELWFIGSFLHKDIFVMDGREFSFPLDAFGTWLELGICLALIGFMVIRRERYYSRLHQVNALFAILVIATSLLHYWRAANIHSPGNIAIDTSIRDRGLEFSDEFLSFSSRENILFIILDELQTPILVKTLQQQEGIRDKLDGFILYSDALGNHPNTIMAVPSMLTGDSYRNQEPIRQYLNNTFSERSFTLELDANGYRSDFHTLPVYCNGALYNCNPIPTGDGRLFALLLLDLGLFRAMPMAAKPLIYNDRAWRVRPLLAGLLARDTIPGEDRAILLWNNLTNGIEVRDQPPRFKLFHSLITHNPEILDADCSRTKPRKAAASEKIKQTTCAMRLLGNLLDKLKQLGIYDNTMVIVASDHGSDIVEFLDTAQFEGRNVVPRHVARSQAALMIKPIGASGPLREDSAPVQLSDLPKTVLESLALDSSSVPGISLLQLENQPRRERAYWHYEDLILTTEQNYFPQMWHYSIRGPADKAESWEFEELLERNPE